MRSRSPVRTRRGVWPFPVGSKTACSRYARASPCQTSLPFCVQMRLFQLSEKMAWGHAPPMWVDVVLPVQGSPEPPTQHRPALAVSVGGEELSRMGGQQRGWRASSLG